MGRYADSVLVLVLLTNLALLGSARLRTMVSLIGLQGVLLGALAVTVHQAHSIEAYLLPFLAVLVKGVLIPLLLVRALRRASIGREVWPIVDFVPSLLAGAAAIGLSFWLARELPLAPEHHKTMLVPASLATVLSGFFLMVARRKAITQVVGYLVLENGVYIMSLCFATAMPLLVELGVLLDVLVGVFVMGILIHRIHRTFASMDTSMLTELRD